jgi:hypothetical protein
MEIRAVSGNEEGITIDPLVVDGHRYNKIVLIPNIDRNAGFSALMTYALNGVRKALERNWLPVVNFDKETTRYFYDPARGDNIWQYFFKPVMSISYSEVKEMTECGQISPSSITTFSEKDIWYWHLRDPERIGTFWLRKTPKNAEDWMQTKRALGRRFVQRYIRVKQPILDEAKAFVAKHFETQFTIGVHIRGTDFAHAEPTDPETYFQAIERLVKMKRQDDYRFFLATDQEQFVEVFKKEYGDKLMLYNCARSRNDIAPFKFANVSPYKKGKDVLIDILLLASCDYVFKCASSVGEYALWFNPDLDYTDFALQSSSVDNTYYMLQNGAYVKLNIGNEGKLKLKLRRIWRIIHQYTEQNVFNYDPRAKTPLVALRYLTKFFAVFVVSFYNLTMRMIRSQSKSE